MRLLRLPFSSHPALPALPSPHRPRRPRWRLSTLAAVLALGQLFSPAPALAQGLPSLGDAVDMSVGAERRLGDSIARELYRDPAYLEDPVLDDYVQQIWQPLLAAARLRGDLTPELNERFAWELMIGRDRSVNAFALPGGYFGLHTGLIALTGSRDELASVLGHELSHVTQRHIARLMTEGNRQTPMLLAAMILGALAASKSGGSGADLGQAVIMGGQAMAMQKQLDFSRDMEREADRMGYGVMTQAGFSAQGAATMFERMQHASRLNDNGSFPYLRSHPLNSERITDMQARFQFRPDAPQSALPLTAEHAMMAARARVLGKPGVDALRAWVEAATPSHMDTQSTAQQAGTLYAAVLSAQQLKDWPAARRNAARLRELVQADPAAARLARLLSADLELQARNPGAAEALMKQPDGSPPDASRPHLLLAAQIAQANGKAATMAPVLRDWVATHPRDAQAWRTLAGLYQAANDPLRAIRAEAEANVAILDYVGARDRFKAAQELVRNNAHGRGPIAIDHYEASIIDTRARENEVKVKEQAEELKQLEQR